jgi:hypothetical protein
MIDLAIAIFCLAGLAAITWRLQKLSRVVESQKQKEHDPLPEILAGLKRELTSLAERTSTLESEARQAPAAVSIRSGMNLNKRIQALRQYRLGHVPADIARTLDMQKAEVDLLIKVHRIVSQQ